MGTDNISADDVSTEDISTDDISSENASTDDGVLPIWKGEPTDHASLVAGLKELFESITEARAKEIFEGCRNEATLRCILSQYCQELGAEWDEMTEQLKQSTGCHAMHIWLNHRKFFPHEELEYCLCSLVVVGSEVCKGPPVDSLETQQDFSTYEHMVVIEMPASR